LISVGSEVQVFPGPPSVFADDGCGDGRGSVRALRVMVDCCDRVRWLHWLLPIRYSLIDWGCSSAGRAPALQAGGQRFDPAQLHHFWSSRRARSSIAACGRRARRLAAASGLRGVLNGSEVLVTTHYVLLTIGYSLPLSSEEIKVCTTRFAFRACFAKIVKRRLIWRLPGVGFATRVRSWSLRNHKMA
jgi:hypothetical protein